MKLSQISIKETQDQILICSKAVDATKAPQFFMKIAEFITSKTKEDQNFVMTGPPMFFYNNSMEKSFNFDPKTTEYEVGFPVNKKILISHDFHYKTLKKQKILSMECTGPYIELQKPIYDKLFQFAEDNNLIKFGEIQEKYISNPAEVPSDQLITELQFPIR